MSKQAFKTYLETYRLRTGFSRAELAFLIGAMQGKNVTRHEKGKSLPVLRTLLAYSLILDARVEDLYEGLHYEIHEELRARARGLCRRISERPKSKMNKRKVEILKRLSLSPTRRNAA
jgi:DNA-binding XRE family transcriptional regulator